MGSPTAQGAETRDRLVSAAEQLMAVRGVDAVSLREIVRASGARNVTALHYHFGDRAGLVRAVLDKHHRDVEARRHAMLDTYEADARPDIRALAAALVRPLAARLADPGGGANYLQILGDLMNRPLPVISPAALHDPSDSLFRWRALVEPVLEDDATRLHRRFLAIRIAIGELALRARTGPHTDDRLFTSHLIDLIGAVLVAPLSAETMRLAAERDAALG
jgi:AcrR family transcriptional regulator